MLQASTTHADSVHVRMVLSLSFQVDPRRTLLPDLVRSLGPVILDLGLCDERELAELDRAVREHLADPRTLMMPHLLVVAWGRKPSA